MRGREGEGPGWKRDRGGVKGGRIRYGGRQERSPEEQENEEKYTSVWSGKWRKSLESSGDLGYERLPELKVDLS